MPQTHSTEQHGKSKVSETHKGRNQRRRARRDELSPQQVRNMPLEEYRKYMARRDSGGQAHAPG